MKHTKYYKGVQMMLASPEHIHKRSVSNSAVRSKIKDGHGCTVTVGNCVFRNIHTAQNFIKHLLK